jgi:hypothetical protein
MLISHCPWSLRNIRQLPISDPTDIADWDRPDRPPHTNPFSGQHNILADNWYEYRLIMTAM